MTFSDIAAAITGEQLETKDTSDGEGPFAKEVARLAYQFYEMRGRRDGHDVEDWLSAERQVMHHYR